MAKPEVTRQILDLLRREQADVGFHIREQWLADALGISRSPVRTALKQLERLQVVRSEQHQGYFLLSAPESGEFDNIELPQTDTERLYRKIASERFANLVGDQVSVAELVRRYDVSRTTIMKVLARMQEDGLVERSAGHAWVFGPALNDEAAYEDSYRYRALIEPAALREPGFHLPAKRAARLRAKHERLISGGMDSEPMSALFGLDAEFHETMGECCGNRFLAQAVRQQTGLRRLSEYEKYNDRSRLREAFEEHLRILDAIEDNDMESAASLLHDHIESSSRRRPDFRKVRVLAHRRLTRT
jgi:DNA-binding GntR family transcriptional regulator